jgi:hypothetical protein
MIVTLVKKSFGKKNPIADFGESGSDPKEKIALSRMSNVRVP